MRKLDRNGIKNVVQRVLDVTLWGHFPYESQNIIKQLEEDDQKELLNELIRQKAILRKQMNKIDSAIYQTKNIILGDEYDPRNRSNRFATLQVRSRYQILDKFINHIMRYIDNEKFDPESGIDFSLPISYDIPYDDKYNHIDGVVIADIKRVINDLWIVKGKASEEYGDNGLKSFISNCKLEFNEEETGADKIDGLSVTVDILVLVRAYISMYIASNLLGNAQITGSLKSILISIRNNLKKMTPQYYTHYPDSMDNIVIRAGMLNITIPNHSDCLSVISTLDQGYNLGSDVIKISTGLLFTYDKFKRDTIQKSACFIHEVPLCITIQATQLYQLFKNLIEF